VEARAIGKVKQNHGDQKDPDPRIVQQVAKGGGREVAFVVSRSLAGQKWVDITCPYPDCHQCRCHAHGRREKEKAVCENQDPITAAPIAAVSAPPWL